MLPPLYYECRRSELAFHGLGLRPGAHFWELQFGRPVRQRSSEDQRLLAETAWSSHHTLSGGYPRLLSQDSTFAGSSLAYQEARKRPPEPDTHIGSGRG